ncbi:MAG TPA: hypothetical protein VK064_03280 [Wenzhouxiangella sp.]|nr:hypothetical protein [Wenzhouxiangella sp.]
MQRFVDVVLSLLLTAASFVLSWPFWRDFEYWAESPTAWRIYFVLGFILGAYVFYVFIGSLRMLFQHARDDAAAEAEAERQALDAEGQP